MSRRYLYAPLVTLIAMGLFSGSAFAKDNEHRREERAKHVERHEIRREHAREQVRDRREHHAREEARERHRRVEHERWEREHRAHAVRHDRRPPGWDKGKKVGWDHKNVPPGDAHRAAREREHWRERHAHTPQSRPSHPVLTAHAPASTTTPTAQPASRQTHTWPAQLRGAKDQQQQTPQH